MDMGLIKAGPGKQIIDFRVSILPPETPCLTKTTSLWLVLPRLLLTAPLRGQAGQGQGQSLPIDKGPTQVH